MKEREGIERVGRGLEKAADGPLRTKISPERALGQTTRYEDY